MTTDGGEAVAKAAHCDRASKGPRNNKVTKCFEGTQASLTVGALSDAHAEPCAWASYVSARPYAHSDGFCAPVFSESRD
jgi:hypothetical protein